MTSSAGTGKSRKAQMREIEEAIQALENKLRAAQPIPVITTRLCSHQTCGEDAPAEYPEDCLIIELGCAHEIPKYEPPPIPEKAQSSLDSIPEVLLDKRAPAASPMERARQRIIQLNLRR